MNITVLYIGSSLLGPLKNAEREINSAYSLELTVSAHNFGSPLSDAEWQIVENDLSVADVVFVIHVMDGENGSRLLNSLKRFQTRHRAVVVINCMPELMRCTRMGLLEFANPRTEGTNGAKQKTENSKQAIRLLGTIGSWVGKQANRGSASKGSNHGQYLKLIELLPGFLRIVPNAGKLRDVKNYLFLFCYFLQPTPANIRSMLL